MDIESTLFLSAVPAEQTMNGQIYDFLLFEDNPHYIEYFLANLALTSFASAQVTTAESLRNGEHLLLERHFDLIFINPSLIENDTTQTLAVLSSLGTHAPVIALNAGDDRSSLLEIVSKGADDCLPKSDLNELRLERIIRFNLGRWWLKENAISFERQKYSHLIHTLHQQEQRMQVALGGQFGVWDWNVNTGVIEYSQPWCRLFGYLAEDIKPQFASWQNLVHPADLPILQNKLQLLLCGSDDAYEYEYRMLHKAGHWLWVFDHGQVLERNPDASAARMVGGHLDISGRRKLEEALQDKEEKFRMLMENIPGTVYRCELDSAWTVHFLSQSIFDFTGYPASDFINSAKRSYASIIHPDDVAMVEKTVLDGVNQRKPFSIEYRIFHASGQIRWCWERGQAHFDSQGGVAWLDGVFFDITEQRQIADCLRQAASVFSHAHEAIMITTPDGEILDVNEAFSRITGYPRSEVLGKKPSLLKSGQHDRAFYNKLWQDLLVKGYWCGEICNRRKNGEIFVEMLTISVVKDNDDRALHFVALFSDITQIKQHANELERIAHYDNLTGLPNRVLLADRVRQSMARLQRNENKLAILFIDLDGFKSVNDTFGHSMGDALLVEVSKRLQRSVREGDTVARLGGDEFVVILCELGASTECESTLQRILNALRLPYLLSEQNIDTISGSIGYTVYPDDNTDSDTLLRHADHAMYVAKQAGKNRFQKFDFREDKQIRANWLALNRIEKALVKGEFCLYVQPKIDLQTGQVIGAEALIRWQHPIRGIIAPIEFLPLIQDKDIALNIDQWVIQEALLLMQTWAEQGLNLSLSVNISARQLREERFFQQLAAQLQKFPELDPSKLEIEILESAALDDLVNVSALIAQCQTLGVRFALDDFGTGYSALTYLKRLSVATLKIDQSFVRDLLIDESDFAIVCGIIGLAGAFKNHTVAEGVENWEQAACLLRLGCEMAQGYVIAYPMPASQLPAWILDFKMPELKTG